LVDFRRSRFSKGSPSSNTGALFQVELRRPNPQRRPPQPTYDPPSRADSNERSRDEAKNRRDSNGCVRVRRFVAGRRCRPGRLRDMVSRRANALHGQGHVRDQRLAQLGHGCLPRLVGSAYGARQCRSLSQQPLGRKCRWWSSTGVDSSAVFRYVDSGPLPQRLEASSARIQVARKGARTGCCSTVLSLNPGAVRSA
jgi:hypothetical protein